MPQITLADIRAAADAKYGPYIVDLGDGSSVTLRNAIRLPKEQRAQLQALLGKFNTANTEARATQDDAEALLRQIFTVVAEDDGSVDRLYAATQGELVLLTEILRGYGKGTQAGEASASAS